MIREINKALLPQLVNASRKVRLKERIKLSTAVACFAVPIDDGSDLVKCIENQSTDYGRQYVAMFLAGKHAEELEMHAGIVLELIKEIVQRVANEYELKDNTDSSHCCIVG